MKPEDTKENQGVKTMQKGYTIDCTYLIEVKRLMLPRPKPRTRSLDGDGETLPIISVECDI